MEAIKKQQERENVKMILHDIAKVKPKNNDYHDVTNQLATILNNVGHANRSMCDSLSPKTGRRPGANSVKNSTERGINQTNRILDSENCNCDDVEKSSDPSIENNF
jgi:hypothetical protein